MVVSVAYTFKLDNQEAFLGSLTQAYTNVVALATHFHISIA